MIALYAMALTIIALYTEYKALPNILQTPWEAPFHLRRRFRSRENGSLVARIETRPPVRALHEHRLASIRRRRKGW